MKRHNFKESLDKSERIAEAEFWWQLYRKFWPDLETIYSVNEDGWAQRGGVDRVVCLKSGKVFTVDEKVRERDWPDFLLERWSDRSRRVPGWIQKKLACDFILYVFLPTRQGYFLPTPILQRAWRSYGRLWIDKAYAKEDGFSVIHGINSGYITENIAVPREALIKSFELVSMQTWEDRED